MLIVGIDTETTGLNPVEDRIAEIGAVLWDVSHSTPVAFFHRFIRQDKPLPELITEITGLTHSLLNKYGTDEGSALRELAEFIGGVQWLCAHNAPFDKGMLDHAYLRQGLFIPDTQWIDTTVDVPYPVRFKNKNLIGLAAEHGFLNPFPHRAVTDVLTMLTILSKYDINQIIANAQEPKVLLWAKTTYKEKDKAKAAGFYYNSEKKMWFKQVFLKNLMEETEKCRIQGFEVQVVNEKVEEKNSEG